MRSSLLSTRMAITLILGTALSGAGAGAAWAPPAQLAGASSPVAAGIGQRPVRTSPGDARCRWSRRRRRSFCWSARSITIAGANEQISPRAAERWRGQDHAQQALERSVRHRVQLRRSPGSRRGHRVESRRAATSRSRQRPWTALEPDARSGSAGPSRERALAHRTPWQSRRSSLTARCRSSSTPFTTRTSTSATGRSRGWRISAPTRRSHRCSPCFTTIPRP